MVMMVRGLEVAAIRPTLASMTGDASDRSTSDSTELDTDEGGPSIYAAIDIGTNSMHLVVARSTEGGGYDVLTTEKEMVRLGTGGGEMKELTPEAIDRGIAALERMVRVAQGYGTPQICAVATSAVREATNKQTFLDRAKAEVGIDVEVISGFEEARLIHLGVLQALPVYEQRLILADIGGGSTELLVGKEGVTLEARSMKLGAIRLTQRFFPDRIVTDEAVLACRNYARSALASVSRDLGGHQPEIAIGSSGTISTVAAMILSRRGGDKKNLNGATFSRDELEALVEEILATDADERHQLSGLDLKRVDIIIGGVLLLSEIFAAFDIEEMMISDFALREGVLFDRFGGADGTETLADIRASNVRRLGRHLDPDPAHAEVTAALACQLFDRTKKLHGFGAWEREILESAAFVHNVGLFISHSSHHKHSYYIIRNTEHLTGFTQYEIELIAQIARYHRKGQPADKHPPFAALSNDDKDLVCLLAGFLRVAIGLDRGHSGSVNSLRVFIDRTEATLTIEPLPNEGADLALEIYSASARSYLLAKALDVDVRIQAPPTEADSYQSS